MPDLPVFTPEQISEDGKNRVTRSTGQGGVAAATVVVGEWLAQQLGWHDSLPTAVSAAMQVILLAVAAYAMNRSRIRANR